MHRYHRTGSTLTLAILVPAVLAATAGSAAALNGCVLERATMVCRMTGRVFRVIEESRSPSGRYAIAWIASAPGVTFETNSVDGTVSVTGGEARNLLVRLRDGAIVAPDVGTHPGDLAAYNHRRSDVRWSADSGVVGILNHDKWETLSAKIFRMAKPVAVKLFGSCASLRPLTRRMLRRSGNTSSWLPHGLPISGASAVIRADGVPSQNLQP